MRTSLRRARRLGAFLLVVLAAGWVFLRRRSPVRWIEPAGRSPSQSSSSSPSASASASASASTELGAPGQLPADVLATDAGLTELPSDEDSVPAPTGTVVVDEVLVAELLSVDATPGPDVPGEDDLVDTEPAVDAPTLAEPVPSGPTPSGPVPSAPIPSESVPSGPTLAEPVPSGPTPAEPTSSGPTLAEPVPMEPVPSEFALAEPAAAGSSAAEPAVSEAEAAGAVAEVVAAEPIEAVVAEEPGPDDESTETELAAPELGIDEPTMTIAREAIALEDEETSIRIPMPTFSEAPTMEIPAVTDDLRAVRGIGPSMERMLHGLGIISFRQLAMLDGVELERVRAELSDFRTRIEREDWVGQARDLHREKYGRDPS